ncbi:MAG: hypothetical protein ACYC9U_06395 [Nitrososphaerales archaeon]
MSSHWRSIEIVLEGKGDRNRIPIEDISEFLERLQILVNHLGDYLTGSDYRSRGRSPDFVRSRCTLVFKSVRVGSLKAELDLEDQQTTLENVPTLGQESLRKFYDLVSIVEKGADLENSLEEMIERPLHRNRIIEDMYKIWPEDRGAYRAKVRIEDKSMIEMPPERKLALQGLLSNVDRKQTTVKGVLGTLRVAPRKKLMRVIGPDGQIACEFPEQLEETARGFLGKPVIVYGGANFDAEGNVKDIPDVTKISPFTSIELKRVFAGKDEFVLRDSLVVSIDYAQDAWVMKNKELGIMATSPDYDECLKEFGDQFAFIWKEYGNSSDANLTKDAKALKQQIIQYVKKSK